MYIKNMQAKTKRKEKENMQAMKWFASKAVSPTGNSLYNIFQGGQRQVFKK